MQCLPDNVPMSELKDYFDTVLRTQMAEEHQRQIMKGLLEAEATRLDAAIEKERQKSFEVNDSTVCPECKKKFQTAFVRYPNGQVVHMSCYDRRLKASQK